MVILFCILFNSLEALYEGLYDEGHKLLSGIFEFILKTMVMLICLAWFQDIALFKPQDKDFISIVISFILVRYALFDAVYNLTRGLNVFYIGNTKLYDIILQKLGHVVVVITKCIALFIGVMFLI